MPTDCNTTKQVMSLSPFSRPDLQGYFFKKKRQGRAVLIFFIVLVFVLCAMPHTATAEKVPWNFTADTINALHDARIIEGQGSVHLWNGEDSLRADFIRYFEQTGWVFLRGAVVVEMGTSRLTAQEAEFDLRSKTGWLRDGTIFSADSHMYFTGTRIRKTGEKSYSFQDGTVTSCTGDTPPWSLQVNQGELRIGEYAWLWDNSFRISDQPVLYTPFMAVPVKIKRQSGFLLPEVDYSSRLGLHINLPYFWAISQETDMTLYQNVMSERGYMQGLEFRHVQDSNSRGLWRFDFLSDTQADGAESDEDSQFAGDGLVRPNTHRWWLRSKYDGYIVSPEWAVKLDMDMVSDQNYLREFDTGFSGFDASESIFFDEFGRDLEDQDALERTSTFFVARSFENIDLAGTMQWTQNLRYANNNLPADKDPTLQRVPELYGFFYKDSIAHTPLEWEMNLASQNFWRRQGTSGMRFEALPTLSMPFTTGPVAFSPAAALRTTAYNVTGTPAQNSAYPQRTDTFTGREGKDSLRFVPSLDIAAFSGMSRVFTFDKQATHAATKPQASSQTSSQAISPASDTPPVLTAMKHSIQGRIDYTNTPHINQDALPYFDENDRLPPENIIRYSLTNLLDTRAEYTSYTEAADGTLTPQNRIRTTQMLRLRLEQHFDYREASRDHTLTEYERRPFSDIEAQLALNPGQYISLTSRTALSPYENKISEQENILELFTEEKRASFLFGYDYRAALDEYKRPDTQKLQQLRYELFMHLSPAWSTRLLYRTNTRRDLEKRAAVRYDNQCYSLDFRAVDEPAETRFEVRITLPGLTL